MKYAIIIPDGAADEPLDELGGKTPLEFAKTPNMDRIAAMGMQGTARTVPEGFESGSDVCTMSLLGYDPAVYHTGRAPLEAAARDIPLGANDWVFRCNLVTVEGGIMKDHSAGGISDGEAKVLIRDLARAVQADGVIGGDAFYTGVSYRNLLVLREPMDFAVKTKPPHEIPNEPIEKYLPAGRGADLLLSIMTQSKRRFDVHEINASRIAAGRNPATQCWLWGQGKSSKLPKFAERFGVKTGCMITGVDLLRGLAKLIGWENHEVAGMTSFHDTNYVGQGVDTARMLDEYDVVVSHVEAPDEASHQADWKTKVDAIEHIDQHVVGPVLEKLQTFPEWKILVLPDHPTNIGTRKHGYAPTCWEIAGSGVKSTEKLPYTEANAAKGKAFGNGHDLMGWFLGKA